MLFHQIMGSRRERFCFHKHWTAPIIASCNLSGSYYNFPSLAALYLKNQLKKFRPPPLIINSCFDMSGELEGS